MNTPSTHRLAAPAQSQPGSLAPVGTPRRSAANRFRHIEQTLAAHARMPSMPPQTEAAAPGTGAASFLRLDRILIPLDFSESSIGALRFALPFARESGARLDLLHVIEPVATFFGSPGEASYWPATHGKQQQRAAAARLKKLAAAEVQPPLRTSTWVREGTPVQVINAAAAELRSDMLVLSTHGHTGLKRFFLGSTAEAVVRRAPCPVLIVRRRVLARNGTPQTLPSERINRILVPVDFSPMSRDLLKYATAFAAQFRASLVLLHAVNRISVQTRVVSHATRLQMAVLEGGMHQLAEFAKCLVPANIEAKQVVRAGTPYDVIRQVARRERADLIIIGTRGHGAVKRFFIGGTAGRVVRHAPCPVLVVRQTDERRRDGKRAVSPLRAEAPHPARASITQPRPGRRIRSTLPRRNPAGWPRMRDGTFA
jgi:nucleotide-binding universal stress UspA family protein